MSDELNLTGIQKRKSEMTADERVRDFQRKLYQKAKQEKECRFHALYDKMYLPYVLEEAYRRVKRNAGSPGVDNKTFTQIEEEGLEQFLRNLQEELKNKIYRVSPVKRVMIPKANGKMRPLGIPTIKDRVAQMACKMIIEPIFEADFQDVSFGFRPEKKAGDAIERIREHLKEGACEVYDADLYRKAATLSGWVCPLSKIMPCICQGQSRHNHRL